jgi:hypothetical protein
MLLQATEQRCSRRRRVQARSGAHGAASQREHVRHVACSSKHSVEFWSCLHSALTPLPSTPVGTATLLASAGDGISDAGAGEQRSTPLPNHDARRKTPR